MSKGRGVSGHSHTQEQLDHYSRTNNDQDELYTDRMNHNSDYNNPNNEEYEKRMENEEDQKEGK